MKERAERKREKISRSPRVKKTYETKPRRKRRKERKPYSQEAIAEVGITTLKEADQEADQAADLTVLLEDVTGQDPRSPVGKGNTRPVTWRGLTGETKRPLPQKKAVPLGNVSQSAEKRKKKKDGSKHKHKKDKKRTRTHDKGLSGKSQTFP